MHPGPNLKGDRTFLPILLLLALVHGLLYVFVVPPWQHYDEPGRFEHAWLIANRPGLPAPGEEDPSMRRELLASMIAHDFFVGLKGTQPSLIGADLPNIGISQLQDQPAYYWLAALPLRALRYADITLQLYAGRLLSLGLYLVSILLAWKMMGELIPLNHPLRWGVPSFMVLLPAYTDVMTMVGDDVGAVVAFSFFLWGSVRLIRRGVTLRRLLWVIGAALLCVETKNTVAVALILVPLALLLAAVRHPLYLWGALLLVGLAMLLAFFGWGDAAFWERNTLQASPTSEEVPQAPWGERALVLEPGGFIRQYLPRGAVEEVQGEVVSLGAWAWSSPPTGTLSLGLDAGGARERFQLSVNETPAFHAFTATVSTQADYVALILRVPPDQGNGAISIDGVLLVPGEHLGKAPPTLAADTGERMSWGARTLTNYVRNGSAERQWPRLRSWVVPNLQRFVGHMPSPSPALASLLDWERTHWIYPREGRLFFETFWARFGWAHVGLPRFWYGFAGGLSVLGVAGGLVTLLQGRYRTWESPLRRALLFLSVAALLVWGGAWLRVHPFHGTAPFLPGARYAFPALFPVALFIVGGGVMLVPARYRRTVMWAFIGLTSLLSVASLWMIVRFYYW